MSKKPPNRPGISLEVGAKVEAQDYLKKWYPARVEKLDCEEKKLLVHFERWSHRYDEWISWDSSRLRPLDRPALRREGLKEEEDCAELQGGEEVLARWTDCRYYPAKIEAVNKDGTYRVQFYDGVVRNVKRIHIKSMPEDAKGQDWVALVRAARSSKPRTSTNSSRSRAEVQGEVESEEEQEEEEGEMGGGPAQSSPTRGESEVMSVKEEPQSATEAPPPSKEDEPPLEEREGSSHHNYCAEVPPTPPPQPTTDQQQPHDSPLPNHTNVGQKSPPPATAAGLKQTAKIPKTNRHTREPIMSSLRSPDPSSCLEEASSFLCPLSGCFKSFRKAKLLDYHLKYYHSQAPSAASHAPNAASHTPSSQSSTPSPHREGRTRATSASLPPPSTSPPDLQDNRRRRTVSSSASVSLQMEVVRGSYGRRKRSSASISSDSTSPLPPTPPPLREQSLDAPSPRLQGSSTEQGFIRMEKRIKMEDRHLSLGRKKDRRSRRERDVYKLKLKKKKKKKKKSRQHSYQHYDDLRFLEFSPPPQRQDPPYLTSPSPKHLLFPRALLQVDLTGENMSEGDFLEDSTTESLLPSGEEQELEELTEEQSESSQEVVRCVCQVDEENGFMIQCEECMCWQHSVCMGLLEDSIPEHYSCYICRDPPGQRWSSKYRHSRDWLVRGHMFGLSVLSENYSEQNSQRIVSTHQLLADLLGLKHLLHGLSLKMAILQDRDSPSLQLWARSWVNSDEQQPMGGLPDCLHIREPAPQPRSHPAPPQALPDTYITSEHSYQKPADPAPGHAPGQLGPLIGENPGSREQTQCTAMWDAGPPENPLDSCRCPFSPLELSSRTRSRACVQWQMNLLTHIEDVHNQVASRMDLIEKELDVLESWLDLSGGLEPPDPLARLPQLKLSIKQLLADLSKLQHISTLCSV